MALATYTDVEKALGRPGSLTEAQQAQVTWWLNGIELIIGSRLGSIDNLDTASVTYVEAETVAEKVRRTGQTETSITVSVDDGSVTRRWETPVNASDISAELWELLAPRRTSSAFSTRPGHDPDPCWSRPQTRTRF